MADGSPRRLLVLISATVLLEITFASVLAPLLPYYEDEFGLSTSALGALAAVYAAGAFVSAVPCGVLAVRVGVRPTVVAGLGIIAVTSLVFGFADTVWLLYATRFGQGVGGCLAWTAGLAWLMAAAPRERRGELIGITMGVAVVGALLGPVLGGLAALTRPDLVFAIVACVCGALAAWAAVTPAARPAHVRRPVRKLFTALREREIRSGVWLVWLAAFLFGLLSVVAPLRLDDLGWGVVAISAAFLVSAGFEACLSPIIGRWSDRQGRWAPVRAGLLAAFIISLVLSWTSMPWPYLLLVIAAGVAYNVYWVPGTALLADGAEKAGLDQALGFALLNVAWAPGNIVGAALGGGLAESTGDAGAYLVAAALCLATLAVAQRVGGTRPAAEWGSG